MSGLRLKLTESDGRGPTGIDMVIEVALRAAPVSPVTLGSYDGAFGHVVDAFASEQSLATNGFSVEFEAQGEDEVVVYATDVHGRKWKPVYTLKCHGSVSPSTLVSCEPHTYEQGKKLRNLYVD